MPAEPRLSQRDTEEQGLFCPLRISPLCLCVPNIRGLVCFILSFLAATSDGPGWSP
jgi:hypothetical protein